MEKIRPHKDGIPKYIEKIIPIWVKGERQNLALYSAAYFRIQKGLGEKESKEIISEICEKAGDDELEMRLEAVTSIFKKDESEIVGTSGLKETFLIYNERGRATVNIEKISNYIIQTLEIRTIHGIREETLEVYQGGVWYPIGKGIIENKIEKLLESYSKNNPVSEILRKIKRKTMVFREDSDKVPEYKRCLLNGVLDLEDVENIKFIHHSKEYNFRTKFPIKYDEKVDCPKIKKFINQTFYPEDIPQVQEWLGLHLTNKYSFKKAQIVYGPSDTGKSVYLNLLINFVGRENISGLSLQEMGRGKPFDLLTLKDKAANICDDLSSGDMSDGGGLKRAVGDGPMNGEKKGGDRINFQNSAKNTNACNIIPSGIRIKDLAYYGRWIIHPLENIIPQSEKNTKLIEELTAPSELTGLLNWAIEGYKRLVKQNGFSNEKTPKEIKALMAQSGKSLHSFSMKNLTQRDGEKISKELMYQKYCEWCIEGEHKIPPISKEKLGRDLKKVTPYIKPVGGEERAWLNVRFKAMGEEF